MRMIFGLILLLGLGLAGFAVYAAKGYIAQNEQQLALERAAREQIVPTTEVIVTKTAVRYGDRLNQEDLTLVRWPVEGVPAGAFTDMALLFPEGQEPRTVLRAMEPGEAILDVKVTAPGEDAGVSSKLAPGMRAFALMVDVSSGVSGFLRPGDRVDVYWTGTGGSSQSDSREFTKLIEAGVKLLAVDQSADKDRSSPTVARTVTVEATPQQVAALAQAQSTGRLQLSLVGAQDEELTAQVEIDQDTLLGIQRMAPVIAEKARVCTIRTRKGAEMVETEFPCRN